MPRLACAQGWVCPGLGVPRAGEIEIGSEVRVCAQGSHVSRVVCVQGWVDRGGLAAKLWTRALL